MITEIIKQTEITQVLLHTGMYTVPSTFSSCNKTFNVENIGMYLYTVWFASYHSNLFFIQVQYNSLFFLNKITGNVLSLFNFFAGQNKWVL